MYRILEGDVMEQMKTLAAASVDAIVTDPPYELGFMGKHWDKSGVGYSVPMWAEALRVLKPGGHLLAFGGARTYHRMACAIEDAGFEIRDQIMWIYGSGFPKSLDVSKAIDRVAGAARKIVAPPPYRRGKAGQQYSETRKVSYDYQPQPITEAATESAQQWTGWGTALKPAHEPIVVARKPLVGTVAANVLEHGTGALNIDACRVEYETVGDGNLALNPQLRTRINGGNGGNIIAHEENRRVVIPNQLGRWPANVIHDGSDEVLEAFPSAPGQIADVKYDAEARKTQNIYGAMKRGHKPSSERVYTDAGGTNFAMKPGARRLDEGSAARFFYCAKTSQDERGVGGAVKNTHPTVKPVDLMAYLCRLVTPPGGTVLDCFMGSGSTGIAALREGFDFIGIELNHDYAEIARARMFADAPLLNRENAVFEEQL